MLYLMLQDLFDAGVTKMGTISICRFIGGYLQRRAPLGKGYVLGYLWHVSWFDQVSPHLSPVQSAADSAVDSTAAPEECNYCKWLLENEMCASRSSEVQATWGIVSIYLHLYIHLCLYIYILFLFQVSTSHILYMCLVRHIAQASPAGPWQPAGCPDRSRRQRAERRQIRSIDGFELEGFEELVEELIGHNLLSLALSFVWCLK